MAATTRRKRQHVKQMRRRERGKERRLVLSIAVKLQEKEMKSVVLAPRPALRADEGGRRLRVQWGKTRRGRSPARAS